MKTDDELWRPMDEAPHDGSDIRAELADGREITIYWDAPFQWWSLRIGGTLYRDIQPIRWRPIPPKRGDGS